SPTKGAHLKGWPYGIDDSFRAARAAAFFFWPMRQASGLAIAYAFAGAARTLPPLQTRKGAAETRNRAHPRRSADSGRLQNWHHPWVRHRSGRGGAMVAFGPARRRHLCLGVV